MRTDPTFRTRALVVLLTALTVVPLAAQATAAPTGTPFFAVDDPLNYAMLALAIVQVVLILALSGIMRTMGGTGAWAKRLIARRGGAKVVLPIALLWSVDASAQAYTGGEVTVGANQLFWVLLTANIFLFIIMMAQINLLRGMVKAYVEEPAAASIGTEGSAPSWADRLMQRLTRRVEVEKEQDILMHHEYDGIRELDNVLPPWWVWLFYGSIAWSVVYLVNVHVINIWPDQRTEYTNEMVQAKADVAAYMATLTNTVDENTVELSTDAGVLASGRAAFTLYCTPCHGADAAGSETSVGPNLTDAHWIHGGGVKNVFATIKYGVPEKGMISWKAQLKPAEIAALTSYILSLQGTGPATQKAPQGELWTEGGTPVDTTGTAPDSTVARADTARLAVK